MNANLFIKEEMEDQWFPIDLEFVAKVSFQLFLFHSVILSSLNSRKTIGCMSTYGKFMSRLNNYGIISLIYFEEYINGFYFQVKCLIIPNMKGLALI